MAAAKNWSDFRGWRFSRLGDDVLGLSSEPVSRYLLTSISISSLSATYGALSASLYLESNY